MRILHRFIRRSADRGRLNFRFESDLRTMKGRFAAEEEVDRVKQELRNRLRFGDSRTLNAYKTRSRMARFAAGSLKAAGLTGLAAVIVGAGWSAFASLSPNVVLTPQRFPNPNGYAELAKAAELLPPLEELQPWISAKDELLKKAFAAGKSDGVIPGFARDPMLSKCSPALQAAREALLYECATPFPESYDTRYPELINMRNLARVCGIQARAFEEAGDWDKATDASLLAVKIGQSISHKSLIFSQGTGTVSEMTGLRGLKRQFLHARKLPLKSQEGLTGLQRMLAGLSDAPGPAALKETIALEKEATLQILVRLLNRPDWRNELFRLTTTSLPIDEGGTGTTTTFDALARRLAVFMVNKRSVLRNYAAYMDAEISIASGPRPWTKPDPPTPNDMLNRLFVPSFKSSFFNAARRQVSAGLFETALRAEIARRQSAIHPENPVRFSPTIADPFGNGPFVFKRKGDGALIYSVGPDGRDDGGAPAVSDKTGNRKRRILDSDFVLYEETTGDLVFP